MDAGANYFDMWLYHELIINIFLVTVSGYVARKIYYETVRNRPQHTHNVQEPDSNRQIAQPSSPSVQHELSTCNPVQRFHDCASRSSRNWNDSNVELGQQSGDFCKKNFDEGIKHLLEAELIDLTPEEFVQLDKEKQLRDMKASAEEYSLPNLYDSVVTQKFTNERRKELIDSAKEDLLCSLMSDEVMDFLNSGQASESTVKALNDLAEEIDMDTLPTLNCDIGNLTFASKGV